MPGGRFRRRGGRSRGGGANRGRNGGRADLRQPRFESQRLGGVNRPDDEEAPPHPGQESEEDTGAEGEDEVISDPEEEEESEHDDRAAATRPYIALLQGFIESSSSRTSKRRKLEHHHDRKRLPESRARGTDKAGVEEEAEQQEQGVDLDLDFVEEAENEAEAELEGHHEATARLQADHPEGQNSDDDGEGGEAGRADPFDSHFAHPDEEAATRKIQAIQTDGWETRPLPASSLRLAASIPKGTTDWSDRDVTTPVLSPDTLNLRQKLRVSSSRKMPSLDRLQQQLAPILFNYHDVLFGDRTARNADSLRRLVCLHVLNHIFKAHHRIINHSYRLARDGDANPDLEFRDQGFTRPKVLFLLPTRHSCLRVVNTLCDLSGPDQEENRRRLDDAFGVPPGGAAAKFGPDKPADFRDLFAGNDDDMFRLGIKFTRKTVKYYTPFYGSDVLLASPLGLRVAMGSDGDRKGGAKLDFDFLSSIEIVVLDQADALLMQNWEHVEFIFEHLNLQPRDAHGCDFGRVRAWYLENQARHYRQTVVLSAFNTPELSELARARCANWSGKLRVQPASYPGVIQQLGVKVRQTFSRFDAESPAADPDSRFAYFTTAVLANLARRSSSSSGGGGSGGEDVTGTLIFVPSYLDFVRLRNHFATSVALAGVTFGALSEYADVPAASRARSHFLAGRHRVLLYTERAHHFRRYRLRGVRRVLFYGLPDNPQFYAEIAGGFLAASEADGTLEPGRGTVRAVFSRYDLLKLERIAGSERVGRMVGDRGDRFDFV